MLGLHENTREAHAHEDKKYCHLEELRFVEAKKYAQTCKRCEKHDSCCRPIFDVVLREFVDPFQCFILDVVRREVVEVVH